LYRQCFNILAMEAEESLPFKEQEEGDDGVSNVLVFPRGAKVPEYIAPSSDPATKMESAQDRVVAWMYRHAAQEVMNELFNGGGASGFSKSQAFQKSVPKIATRAEILETAENNLMRKTMKFKKTTWTGSVKYKDRYDLTNLTDWITQLTMFFVDLGLPMISETWCKEQWKKAVFMFDGKVDKDVLAKTLAEIDKADLTKWFDRIVPKQLPKATPGAVGAAAQQKPKNNSKGITSRDVAGMAAKGQSNSATNRLKPKRQK
jgi:hypothetical protein